MEDLIEGFIREVIPDAAVPPVASAASASVTAVATDYTEYDDQGVAINAGATSLASKGFRAGAIVEEVKMQKTEENTKTNTCEIQYRINHVNDDGSVVMSKLDVEGKVSKEITTMSHDEFPAVGFKQPKVTVELIAGYPGNRIDKSKLFLSSVSQCIAVIGLHQLVCELDHTAEFFIQHRPTIRVRVKQTYEIGQLKILLLSTLLAPCKYEDASTKFIVSVGNIDVIEEHFEIKYVGSEQCRSPFFHITKSSHKQQSNMSLDTMTTTSNVVRLSQ